LIFPLGEASQFLFVSLVNLKELNLTIYSFSRNERLYIWVEPIGELLVQGRPSRVCFISDNGAVEPKLVIKSNESTQKIDTHESPSPSLAPSLCSRSLLSLYVSVRIKRRRKEEAGEKKERENGNDEGKIK
jgi:hypothetical protein